MTRFTMRSDFATPEALRFVIEHYQADRGGIQTTDRLGLYVENLNK
jgi:hypothetical protein